MNGSTASVSSNSGPRDLVVSLNWIGDAIMAMPAVQLYRRLHPENHVTVLARGVLADLWAMSPAADDVVRYDGRPGLFHPLHASLRDAGYDQAWVLPNSFRSALIPYRAGIPVRRGVPGRLRSMLLTDRIRLILPSHHRHQAWEYIHLMNPNASVSEIPRPQIKVGENVRGSVDEKFGSYDGPLVGMIPGAARGPSKRWPEAHFLSLAKRFVREGCTVLLFGGPDDAPLCERISESSGSVVNLAGRTSLPEWAALMLRCRVIVANDSGGMHLAAALGIPVVALFGMTDPDLTGPIGDSCVIIQKSRTRMRDIPRDSAEAIKSLAEIRPEEVYESARVYLAGDPS